VAPLSHQHESRGVLHLIGFAMLLLLLLLLPIRHAHRRHP
jgi:hypothetical protein